MTDAIAHVSKIEFLSNAEIYLRGDFQHKQKPGIFLTSMEDISRKPLLFVLKVLILSVAF